MLFLASECPHGFRSRLEAQYITSLSALDTPPDTDNSIVARIIPTESFYRFIILLFITKMNRPRTEKSHIRSLIKKNYYYVCKYK